MCWERGPWRMPQSSLRVDCGCICAIFLKLKIMLGKDSFLANFMKCNKDAGPYSVRVVPHHASKPRDVVLAGTYHWHLPLSVPLQRFLLCSQTEMLYWFKHPKFKLDIRRTGTSLPNKCEKCGQIPFLHGPTTELAVANISAIVTNKSPKPHIWPQWVLSMYDRDHQQESGDPSLQVFILWKKTQRIKWNRDPTGTVKDGHISSSHVQQQGRLWKCLCSCFRRNSRDIDEAGEAHWNII